MIDPAPSGPDSAPTLPALRIIPLGGLGEIGKNMCVIEYDGEALVIDAGIMFPDSDMFGIDYIIPDLGYLKRSGVRVVAIIITHGHEDHTGAIAHLLNAVSAPVYATPLTCGLLDVKLRSARHADRAMLNRFRAGDVLELGPFRVETFHVCHSIPDCVGLGITTPVGLIVHTGDFKIDHTPVDNWPTDFAALAGFAARKPLLLLSDSTNADQPGWTPSERVVDDAFDKVFRAAQGRIIVATFASLISRIQQVADAAVRFERKLAITGSSMSDNIRMAINLGYLQLPPDLIISVDQAVNLPPEKIVFMATGTQGEPSSVLNRLAAGRHNKLDLIPGDTVIVSAHAIPGNEEGVYRTINKLIKRGAEVIYDPIAAVHVSGHASQEEQKLMLSLVRPRYFMPVHGELRHLKAHARLAEQVGIPRENIAVVENGTQVEFSAEGEMRIGERYPGGHVFVDGGTVGEITFAVLREREHLSRDGILIVNALIDRNLGTLRAEPQVITRGYILESELDLVRLTVREAVERAVSVALTSNPPVADLQPPIQSAVERAIQSLTRRRPQVFALVTEI